MGFADENSGENSESTPQQNSFEMENEFDGDNDENKSMNIVENEETAPEQEPALVCTIERNPNTDSNENSNTLLASLNMKESDIEIEKRKNLASASRFVENNKDDCQKLLAGL